jgi:hypothetical protein
MRLRQFHGFALVLFLLPNASPAKACSDVLSTLVAAALRPVLESADLCRALKHTARLPFGRSVTVGVDHTDKVELRSLEYCPSDTDSTLQASVFVRCKTSDAAVIKFSVQEVFDIRLRVQNSNCEVLDLHVTPRGEIGRLVANVAGLPDRIKAAAAKDIQKLCK